MQAREVDRLLQLPTAEVARADIADGSLPYQRVQRGEGLLQRRPVVPDMHLVQVDVVRTEPAEAGPYGVEDVLAGQTTVVRPGAHLAERLCGDDVVVTAPGLQPAAEDLLGPAVSVDVGGVDEGAARVGEGVQDLVTRLLAGLRAEHHRAQAQFAHLETGPSEKSMLHGRDAMTWSALQLNSGARTVTARASTPG